MAGFTHHLVSQGEIIDRAPSEAVGMRALHGAVGLYGRVVGNRQIDLIEVSSGELIARRVKRGGSPGAVVRLRGGRK